MPSSMKRKYGTKSSKSSNWSAVRIITRASGFGVLNLALSNFMFSLRLRIIRTRGSEAGPADSSRSFAFMADLAARSRACALRPRRVGQAGVLREERLRASRPQPSFVLLGGSRGLPRGHEPMLAGADEVGAAHAPQRLAQGRPVVGV